MKVWRNRKLQSSAVILLVAILAYTTVLDKMVDKYGMQWVNDECTTYLEDWSSQALATAATAAVINAGLSVIEDSEIQAAPAGLGASIALGDAVRPVNDTASRLVSVALASAVSLEIQKILISVGAAVGLKWFLLFSMAFLLLAVWFDWRLLRRLAWGLFVLALLSRFLIPGAVFMTGKIGDHFTEAAYTQTQEQFEQLESETTKTKDLVVDVVSADGGVLNAFKQLREVQEQLSGLIGSLDDMTATIGKAAVSLLAVFVVQTMLMPLLVLWGLIKLPGYLLDASGTEGAEQWFLTVLRGRERPGGTPNVTRVSQAEA